VVRSSLHLPESFIASHIPWRQWSISIRRLSSVTARRALFDQRRIGKHLHLRKVCGVNQSGSSGWRSELKNARRSSGQHLHQHRRQPPQALKRNSSATNRGMTYAAWCTLLYNNGLAYWLYAKHLLRHSQLLSCDCQVLWRLIICM
jgi:hypothetical protein